MTSIVEVFQEEASVVEVITAGIQGPKGDKGDIGLAGPDGNVQVLGAVSALRALTGGSFAHVLLRGSGSGVTGVLGVFAYDASDTTSADNGGTVIVDADGRRWKRVFTGPRDARWFGAVGDGVANDRAALQAAIDQGHAEYLATGRGVDVLVPAGIFGTDYHLSNWSLTLSTFPGLIVKSGVNLKGAGPLQTIIKGLASTANALGSAGTSYRMIMVQSYASIENMTIDGDKANVTRTNSACHMVRTNTAVAATAQTTYVTDVAFRNVVFARQPTHTKEGFGLMLAMVDGADVVNCKFLDNGGTGLSTESKNAYWLADEATRGPAKNIRVSNYYGKGNGWSGSSWFHCDGVKIVGYTSLNCGKLREDAGSTITYDDYVGNGLNFEWARNVEVHNFHIEGCHRRGISFHGDSIGIRLFNGVSKNNQVFGNILNTSTGIYEGDGGEITVKQGADATPNADGGPWHSSLTNVVEFHNVSLETQATLAHVRVSVAVQPSSTAENPNPGTLIQADMTPLLFVGCPGIEFWRVAGGSVAAASGTVQGLFAVRDLPQGRTVELPALSAWTNVNAGDATTTTGITGSKNASVEVLGNNGAAISNGRRTSTIPILKGTTQTGLWAYTGRFQVMNQSSWDLGIRGTPRGGGTVAFLGQSVRIPNLAGLIGKWVVPLCIAELPGDQTDAAATILCRTAGGKLYIDFHRLILLDGYGKA